MNARLLPVTLIACFLLAGCGLFSKSKQANDNQPQVSKPKKSDNNGNSGIQKIDFVTGVSSVTVEKLAAKNQCASKLGAGQISPKGPVEMYRIQCDDGRVLMARCELRQCQFVKN
jgi:hypothetical protein